MIKIKSILLVLILLSTIASAQAIWVPKPGTTWNIQLNGKLDTSYNVKAYDLDLYDTPKETIDSLHKRGIKVICYFSGGSYEDWRFDAKLFPKDVLGKPLEGWPGEKWLDIRKITKLAPIMKKRLDLAVSKGCDAVDPDNMDGYTNTNGFKLTGADQLKYNQWMADEAHKRGLSIGLKNDLNQVKELVAKYDFSINEQCFAYNECDLLKPFIANQKAVFNIEYSGTFSKICAKAKTLKFSTIKKKIDLQNYVQFC